MIIIALRITSRQRRWWYSSAAIATLHKTSYTALGIVALTFFFAWYERRPPLKIRRKWREHQTEIEKCLYRDGPSSEAELQKGFWCIFAVKCHPTNSRYSNENTMETRQEVHLSWDSLETPRSDQQAFFFLRLRYFVWWKKTVYMKILTPRNLWRDQFCRLWGCSRCPPAWDAALSRALEKECGSSAFGW